MKIDMSNVNIKEILGKLSVLKSNLSILASIIITLVAVLLFIPVKMLSGGLEKTVKQKSLRMGSQIKSARSQAVPKDQWKELAKYERIYEKDANQIAILAIQSTQRELLSYDIFPSPKDTSSLIFKAFGERYQAAIDGLINQINAKDCPTKDELIQGMANASGTSSMGGGSRQYSTPSSRQPGGLRFGGSRGFDSPESEGVMATIRDEICFSRAKSISAYANPVDLTGYEFWGEYKYDVKPEDAIQDCWFYQLSYWMIEDVFSTIGAMNAGSTKVLTSPLKRLIYVRFGEDAGDMRIPGASSNIPGRSPSASQSKTVRPSYIDKEEMAGLSADPHTNRLGDVDLDVMHFTFSVVIEVKSVLPFMKELCSIKKHKFKGFFDELPVAKTCAHNQITILKSAFFAIERSDAYHALYHYGQDAVVELELACEYIFNSQAYDAIKPEQVRPKKDPEENKAGQR